MYPTPGYTNEKIYIYYVKKGAQAASHPDEGEFVETLFIPVADVKKMLSEGQLNDGKTIIALQAYFLSQTI
jgi:ADP-ribose pyrophosphatase